MRVCFFALVLAGCGFRSSLATSDASDTPIVVDGGLDAAVDIDAGSGPLCLGQYVQVCLTMPATSVVLSQAINTGTSPLCAASVTSTPAIDACVIAGQSIMIGTGTTVRVTGTRPLILIASDQITISGTLDVASHRNGSSDGPAASAGPCNPGTEPKSGTSGGGGWGGSFSTAGGNGGSGIDPQNAAGGIAATTSAILSLRGGCPGGSGANNNQDAGSGGPGGHGGGAVMLLAQRTVTIESGGVVNASGGGGSPGKAGDEDSGGGGGGGGGSGGTIVLDAPTVRVPGQCFANGGGGGEGGTPNAGGSSGGESSAPDQRGIGGAGQPTGGNGGDGFYGGVIAMGGAAATGNGGGGGGGGGAGIIRVFATAKEFTTDLAHVSPLPQ